MMQLPNNITRVTGGDGGEVYLIAGREGAAVVDAGMIFCGAQVVRNIKAVLGAQPLDFVLVSHTHYDHVGGIPILRRAWPELTVIGEAHGKRTLQKSSAQRLIRELSQTAADMFGGEMPDYDVSEMTIDEVVRDGDIIDLGNVQIEIVKTPGHTKCSLSFFLRNESILFTSETTGVPDENGVEPSYLTGFKDTLDSIKRCRDLHPKCIITPHYGLVSGEFAKNYWDMAQKSMISSRDFILRLHREGYDKQDIIKRYAKKFRSEQSLSQQPIEAFEMNAGHTIDVVIREFSERD